MYGQIHGNTYVKFENERDKLDIGGESWTIKVDELTEDVDFIIYITRVARYGISRKDAEQHGFVRTLGGEQKLIVQTKYWEVK